MNEDEVRWTPGNEALEERRREDDLRVRMVALDMSITALPQYTHEIDSPDTRSETQDRLIKHFENYLRTGELGS